MKIASNINNQPAVQHFSLLVNNKIRPNSLANTIAKLKTRLMKGKVTAYEPEGPSGRRLSPVSVALSD